MFQTAEFVSLGHPDKTADFISEYILDRLLEQDLNVKYAVEVMIKGNRVVLGGEICGNVNLKNLENDVKMPFVKSAMMSIMKKFGGNMPLKFQNLKLSI